MLGVFCVNYGVCSVMVSACRTNTGLCLWMMKSGPATPNLFTALHWYYLKLFVMCKQSVLLLCRLLIFVAEVFCSL